MVEGMAAVRKSRSGKAAAAEPEPEEVEVADRGRKSRTSTRGGKRAKVDDEIGDGEVVFQGGAAASREGERAGGVASPGKRARNSSSNPGDRGDKKARLDHPSISPRPIARTSSLCPINSPPPLLHQTPARFPHRSDDCVRRLQAFRCQ